MKNKFTVHITITKDDIETVNEYKTSGQLMAAQLYLYDRATSEVRSKKNQATITRELLRNWEHVAAIVEDCGSMSFSHLIKEG